MEKRCTVCKEIKDTDTDFFKNTRLKDGYQSACKECMNKAYKESRNKKKQHYIKIAARRVQNNTKKIRDWKSNQGCYVCRESFAPALDLHHINPNEKEHSPADLSGYSFKKFLKEAEQCVVLCATCHRKVHGGYFELLGVGQLA